MSAEVAATPRWGPHLRGAFVLFHLVAILLLAMPAPEGGMTRAAWADPTVQGELEGWRERLGVSWTQEEFEDRLFAAAKAWMGARSTLLAPFRPYYRLCGTDQSWRMFVAPQRVPTRLEIDLQQEEGGPWTPIFVERSPVHRWRADQLGNERMRSAIFRYGWRHYQRSYQALAEWLALRAAEDFPGATAIRTRWYRYRTLSPQAAGRGETIVGDYERSLVLRLQAPGSAR